MTHTWRSARVEQRVLWALAFVGLVTAAAMGQQFRSDANIVRVVS
jgi:hypothetical protein